MCGLQERRVGEKKKNGLKLLMRLNWTIKGVYVLSRRGKGPQYIDDIEQLLFVEDFRFSVESCYRY